MRGVIEHNRNTGPRSAGGTLARTKLPILCLSLPLSCYPSRFFPPLFLTAYPFLFFILSSSSDSISNSPDSWPSLSESDPLCLERLRYICWCAQCSSGRPSPADIPQHASQRVCN
ncbi:uncharacterized protein AKAME5_000648800 [Lates japonicus]|uniref:Uncharacterized protein n=1 Tax=Lates japonicus TaxID=270547 RepID=A0AAD3MH15_LATJO|nr:uncharacterized protein AKAME5_000648800 [Lates japonicus]